MLVSAVGSLKAVNPEPVSSLLIKLVLILNAFSKL